MRAATSRYYSLNRKEQLGRVNPTEMGRSGAGGRRLTVETVSVWVAFVAVVACNALFETMALGGTTVASVSAQVFAWFSPAPYAFFIWGVIYAAVAAWLVYFTYDAPNRAGSFSMEGLMFVASCALNIAWLALFHYEQIAASLVVMAALWITVFSLYFTQRRDAASPVEWVPFSIYAGWLTVATVVNAVNLATRILGGGMLVVNEVSVVLLTAGVLALAYAVRRAMDDPVMPLVVLWAVVAVGVRLVSVSPAVAVIVFALAVVAAIATYVPFESLRGLRQTPGSV